MGGYQSPSDFPRYAVESGAALVQRSSEIFDIVSKHAFDMSRHKSLPDLLSFIKVNDLRGVPQRVALVYQLPNLVRDWETRVENFHHSQQNAD